jgi:hypothetical protein
MKELLFQLSILPLSWKVRPLISFQWLQCRGQKRHNALRETVLGEQQIVGMVYDFALGGSQIRY